MVDVKQTARFLPIKEHGDEVQENVLHLCLHHNITLGNGKTKESVMQRRQLEDGEVFAENKSRRDVQQNMFFLSLSLLMVNLQVYIAMI